MNIQIFGTNKCFDTKKAQRYFKERGVRFQMIDLKEKGMSRGEFENVTRRRRTNRPLRCWTLWWTGRRRTSCSRTSSCSKRPSSATGGRPPWAISPMSGRAGNNTRFHKKSTRRILHFGANRGILKHSMAPTISN